MNRRLELVKAKELVLTEKPIPQPPAKGLVVKIHYAGICHSDLHFYKDQLNLVADTTVPWAAVFPKYFYPTVLGHEIAGEVYSLGKEAGKGGLAKGDKVVIYPWLGCGECDYCKADMTNSCKEMTHIIGVYSDGGLQTYVSVRDTSAVAKVPAGVPLDIASTVTCSGLTTFNAVSRAKEQVEKAVKITGKSTLLIIGAGGLGLWAVEWAKNLLPKACKVAVADISEEKLKDAKKAGADEVVYWDIKVEDDKLVADTMATCGDVNVVIDFVGITPTVDKAFKILALDGLIVLIGLGGGTCPIPLAVLPLASKKVVGILTGTQAQMVEALNNVAKYKLRGPPITHVKLEDVADVFDKMEKGKLTGRCVVSYL